MSMVNPTLISPVLLLIALISGYYYVVNRKYGLLLDFDGLLIDMEPFAYELEDGQPLRWRRFLAHTAQAATVPTGLQLVEHLTALGWFYSVSTTRPRWNHAHVRRWLNVHMPAQPRAVHARVNFKEPALCKAEHYRRSCGLEHPNKAVCTLFVDDEFRVVDELEQLGIPALHISDLILPERELLVSLQYSKKKLLENEQRRIAAKNQAS